MVLHVIDINDFTFHLRTWQSINKIFQWALFRETRSSICYAFLNASLIMFAIFLEQRPVWRRFYAVQTGSQQNVLSALEVTPRLVTGSCQSRIRAQDCLTPSCELSSPCDLWDSLQWEFESGSQRHGEVIQPAQLCWAINYQHLWLCSHKELRGLIQKN